MSVAMRECEPSELNLFGPVGIQNSIIDSNEIEFQNINSLDGATVIEFNVVNKGVDTYIDLASTTIFMSIQMLKEDGSKYKEVKATGKDTVDERASQPSFINNILSSIIKSVTISMNGTVVSTCPLYAFKHYIDTITNYGSDATASQLSLGGFFKDAGGDIDEEGDKNNGAKYRRTLLFDSGILNLYSKLNCDCLNTPRLLMNGIDLKFTLTLNDPSFYLFGKSNSQLVIHKSSILTRFCKINENVILYHNRLLNSSNAIYPFTRSNVRSYIVPTGIQSITFDNIVNGLLPDSIVFGFVTNEAFNGTKSKSPYNFQPHNLQSFSLSINGIPISGHPIECYKYHYHKYAQAYRSLFLNTQSLYKDASSMITYTDFRDGYFILPINLTPTLELNGGLCEQKLKQGTIKVDLKFHAGVESALNMIVYSETSAMISVDKNRNIMVEY